LPLQGRGHPVSVPQRVNRQTKAKKPYSNGGW
jgi:hypothetical protein